jgi:hypothetical protein
MVLTTKGRLALLETELDDLDGSSLELVFLQAHETADRLRADGRGVDLLGAFEVAVKVMAPEREGRAAIAR